MKKLLVSDITNTIYLANAKPVKNNPKLFETIGEKQDFTDEAIKAVFQWFMNNYENEECKEAFDVTFKNCPYVLRMIKIEESEGEG